MKKLTFILLAFVCAFVIVSCGDDEKTITYENTIKNDLNTSCATPACHAAGFSFGSLATYDDVVAFVGFGRILGSIKHEDGFSPMPKGGDKWSDAKIERFEKWINDGLLEK